MTGCRPDLANPKLLPSPPAVTTALSKVKRLRGIFRSSLIWNHKGNTEGSLKDPFIKCSWSCQYVRIHVIFDLSIGNSIGLPFKCQLQPSLLTPLLLEWDLSRIQGPHINTSDNMKNSNDASRCCLSQLRYAVRFCMDACCDTEDWRNIQQSWGRRTSLCAQEVCAENKQGSSIGDALFLWILKCESWPWIPRPLFTNGVSPTRQKYFIGYAAVL